MLPIDSVTDIRVEGRDNPPEVDTLLLHQRLPTDSVTRFRDFGHDHFLVVDTLLIDSIRVVLDADLLPEPECPRDSDSTKSRVELTLRTTTGAPLPAGLRFGEQVILTHQRGTIRTGIARTGLPPTTHSVRRTLYPNSLVPSCTLTRVLAAVIDGQGRHWYITTSPSSR